MQVPSHSHLQQGLLGFTWVKSHLQLEGAAYCDTTTRIDTSNSNNKLNNTQPVKPRFLCHASEYMGNPTP